MRIMLALLPMVAIGLASAGAQDAPDPGVPEMGPYTVRLERSHFVPMRDGVRLSTDLYIPEGVDEPLGTVLVRTPYNKGSQQYRGDGFSMARYFASHGFVFAVQDKRGKFESEGRYLTTDGDIEDGNDTLDWIADQPWSNGKVGMMGCSYPGFTTMMAAQSLNPHLAAIIPQSAAMATGSLGGRYSLLWRRGGTVNLSMALWHMAAGSKVFYRPPAGLTRQDFLEIVDLFDPTPKGPDLSSFADPAFMQRVQNAYLTLPITDILDGFDAPPNDFELMTSLDIADPWWDERGYLTDESRVDVPALHVNSWHDYGVAETLIHFNFFRENALSQTARDNQYVIIAPTSHCQAETVSEQTMVGDLNVGDARFDFWGTYVRWYDRWLNGNEDALEGMPHVQYYNVGANEWRSADEWPLPGTEYRKFYLASGGRANSRHGDGRLEAAPSANDAASDSYVYDPATPFTTVSALTNRDLDVWNGVFDRRELENRADVLIYTSDPLEEAVDVTGPIKAVLYVSSSVRDTDFDLTLVDVFPDGRAMGVYEGTLRARYREGFDRKVLMEPGEIYELEIDMNATSNTFLPGHRIRIEIASSRFPNHDRNLNTGGDNFNETEFVQAVNVIHHSPEHPSHVVLPVVPHKSASGAGSQF
jgi:predicted acyl esterase